MMPFFVASNIHIKVINYLKTLGNKKKDKDLVFHTQLSQHVG